MPIVYPLNAISGVPKETVNKFQSVLPSELAVLLEYRNPLFPTTTQEINDFMMHQL
jgi:hypothetical protein